MSVANKFNLREMPRSIFAMAVALGLLAMSAATVGIFILIESVSEDGVGPLLWLLPMWVLVGLVMLCGATLVIAAPIALAALVIEKPTRTGQNLIVAGVGVLVAAGYVMWVLSWLAS